MDEVLNLEKRDDNISEEVEEKLKELLERMPRKNEEEILTVRMHELALSKILVFTHGKSDFRLVKAHYHIGEAYLNYKCYEQAIDHLQSPSRRTPNSLKSRRQKSITPTC